MGLKNVPGADTFDTLLVLCDGIVADITGSTTDCGREKGASDDCLLFIPAGGKVIGIVLPLAESAADVATHALGSITFLLDGPAESSGAGCLPVTG
jgi:hypothetical protein